MAEGGEAFRHVAGPVVGHDPLDLDAPGSIPDQGSAEKGRGGRGLFIGEQLLDLQHIGSTAIPGTDAKPIIDIAAAVRTFEESRCCVEPLEGIDYIYKGEHGIPRRHYFVKGSPRTHHLHMVEIQSEDWRVPLVFRDFLRRNPDAAEEYTLLKRTLAKRFPRNRVAYTDGKAAFVRDVLTRAAGEE